MHLLVLLMAPKDVFGVQIKQKIRYIIYYFELLDLKMHKTRTAR